MSGFAARPRSGGGGLNLIPLDEATAEQIYQQEPSAQLAPETLYDKRWAVTLVDQALHRLGSEYAAAGKRTQFDQFKGLLLTEGSGELYRETARQIGMTEGAVKVAVHRLRQRFRETVRAGIAQTVVSAAEVEGELHCLMAAMSG